MCQFFHKAMNWVRKLAGMPVEQYFPVEMIQARPPATVQQAQCLVCDRSLSQSEMFPLGRAPRYMCRPCYENMAYNTDRNTCLWCGRLLPNHKIQQRIANPRELRHGFCDGNCFDYHVVLAGLVLGAPFNVMGQMPNHLQAPGNFGQGGFMHQLPYNSGSGSVNQLGNGNQHQPRLVGGKPVKYLP